MQLFTRAIIQVGIFMICAQVLIHFRPNGSYEKYMKMLVSVMILVQVFCPLINLVTGGKESVEERVSWFEAQIQESMAQAQTAARQTDALLNRMTLEEVRQNMEEAAAAGGEEPGQQSGESGVSKEVQPEQQGEQKAEPDDEQQREQELGQSGSGIQPVERIEIEIGN